MKSIFVFVILLFSLVCNAQTPKIDCSTIKKGKWKYSNISPATYSERNDTMQISYYPNGMINRFKVVWVDSCVFNLIFIGSNRESDECFYQLGDMIKVSIVNVMGECYSFITEFKGKLIPIGEMCKVK